MIRSIAVGMAAIIYFSSMVTAQSLTDVPHEGPGRSLRELLEDVVDEGDSIVSVRPQYITSLSRPIERQRRDSVWNGVLIGAGAGALAGFGLGRSLDSPACPRAASECGQGAVVGTIGGAFWGAIGGWITDALIRKREKTDVDCDPAATRRLSPASPLFDAAYQAR